MKKEYKEELRELLDECSCFINKHTLCIKAYWKNGTYTLYKKDGAWAFYNDNIGKEGMLKGGYTTRGSYANKEMALETEVKYRKQYDVTVKCGDIEITEENYRDYL